MRPADSGASLDDLLSRAHSALERSARFLSDPQSESLDAGLGPLAEAADALRRYNEIASAAPPDSARARRAAGIRNKVQELEILLRHAQTLHQGWIQVVANDASGYTAQGAPDLTGLRRTIAVDC